MCKIIYLNTTDQIVKSIPKARTADSFVRLMLIVGAYWRSHLRVGVPQSNTKHRNTLLIRLSK